MTIQEYVKKNQKKVRAYLLYEFAEVFECWIGSDGLVYMEEYSEGSFELKHIETIEDYKALYKLLVGVELITK